MRRALTALILTAAAFVFPQNACADAAGPQGKRREQLVQMVREDCGSCHGLRLTGGLGPALTPEALKDRSETTLAQTILEGRPGTPMPPWRPFLTEGEAHWIARMLRQGFPDAN